MKNLKITALLAVWHFLRFMQMYFPDNTSVVKMWQMPLNGNQNLLMWKYSSGKTENNQI
jgi:hypothetical protein